MSTDDLQSIAIIVLGIGQIALAIASSHRLSRRRK